MTQGGPTTRQLEVLRGVVHGLTTKELAWRLGISARTVEGHLHALRQLTGARSMGELCAVSAAEGWVTPQQGPVEANRSRPDQGSPKERRAGRPTVMTPQLIRAARELLVTHTAKETARNLRISRSTLYAHMDVIAGAATSQPDSSAGRSTGRSAGRSTGGSAGGWSWSASSALLSSGVSGSSGGVKSTSMCSKPLLRCALASRE